MTNDHSLDMHFFFFSFFLVVRSQRDGDDVGLSQPGTAEIRAGMGREEWRRGKVAVGNLIRVSGQWL